MPEKRGSCRGTVSGMPEKEKKTEKVPIIFITAKDTENDTVTGFNLGADDYISKPFYMEVVLTKIKNILRTYSFVCFAKLGFGFFAVYFFAISPLYQRRIVSGVKNSHFLRRFQDNFLPFFANIARSESVYFMRLPSDSNFDFKIRLAASK